MIKAKITETREGYWGGTSTYEMTFWTKEQMHSYMVGKQIKNYEIIAEITIEDREPTITEKLAAKSKYEYEAMKMEQLKERLGI